MKKIFGILLIMLAVIIAAIGIISGYHTGIKSGYPVAYSEYITRYSKQNNLDTCLVMAVIKVESNYIPEARSDYAYGLMQLTKETAEWNARKMGLEDYDWHEPETNIRIGCYYLRYLINKYGDTDTALAAYNAGGGNVDSWLSSREYSDDGKTLKLIPFTETRNYVRKVNNNWNSYKKLYG